jgi:hypothetical protein
MLPIKLPLTRHISLLLFLLSPLPACSDLPGQYSAEALQVRVVDAKTKQPLAEVIVVADWQLHFSTVAGRMPGGHLMIMETVTDQAGLFSFAAWGPMKRPFNTFMDDRDPAILLFKPGYEFKELQNIPEIFINEDTAQVRKSMWNGKTIELKKFEGKLDEYAWHLGFLTTSIELILSEKCGWKRIPRMIMAVSQQSEVFRQHGIYGLPSIESLEIRYSNFKEQCGSVKEFFREYRP